MKLVNGKQIGDYQLNKGQVSLEIGFSLVCVFLLLFASFKIFAWLNERIVLRQEKYEEMRVIAGGTPIPCLEFQLDDDLSHKIGVIVPLDVAGFGITPGSDTITTELGNIASGDTSGQLKLFKND